MKRSSVSVTAMCLLLFAASSCTTSKDCITKPPPEPNILMYCSFEEDDRPSLAGWWPDDTTSHMDFSRNVPPNGGSWSLSIRNALNPSYIRVARTVPALAGTTSYEFSFWARTKGKPGIAELGEKTGPGFVTRAIRLEADTAWVPYSASLTCHGDPGDSILVGLWGASTSEPGTTWFDLVKLEKVD